MTRRLARAERGVADVGRDTNAINPMTISLAAATLGMLLIALVGVGGFTVLAQRRLRSIGMLGAQGATGGNVGLVVSANGFATGVVGAVAGFALGLAAWLAYRPRAGDQRAPPHRGLPAALGRDPRVDGVGGAGGLSRGTSSRAGDRPGPHRRGARRATPGPAPGSPLGRPGRRRPADRSRSSSSVSRVVRQRQLQPGRGTNRRCSSPWSPGCWCYPSGSY